MKLQPFYKDNKLVGVKADAENPIEALLFKFIWEKNMSVVGYSAGMTPDMAELVVAFDPVRKGKKISIKELTTKEENDGI
jgi:hypothetical protein